MPNVDLSLIGALTAAVGTLAGVVTYMGRWFIKEFDGLKAEVIDCRRDRENLWKDRDKLWERIADLDQKMETK
jgi:hypothetical protein